MPQGTRHEGLIQPLEQVTGGVGVLARHIEVDSAQLGNQGVQRRGIAGPVNIIQVPRKEIPSQHVGHTGIGKEPSRFQCGHFTLDGGVGVGQILRAIGQRHSRHQFGNQRNVGVEREQIGCRVLIVGLAVRLPLPGQQ